MTIHQELIRHYEDVWSNKARIYSEPIARLNPDFRVLEFAPTASRPMWTYATCGMSGEEKHPVELHIFSSGKDEGLIELLAAVAYYHKNDNELGLNHTVYFGRPWQKKSRCMYGLISLPYLDGPVLEDMTDSEDRKIKFYWLVPVTEKEKEYVLAKGIDALEHKFEARNFNYLDPERKSVV